MFMVDFTLDVKIVSSTCTCKKCSIPSLVLLYFYNLRTVSTISLKREMSCVGETAGTSNAILAAATREAAHLTDREREIILGVLTKDEQIRRQQQIKVMHLKAELQNLRRKGALKVSNDWDSTGPDPDRSCGRCRVELGRVINRGAYCRACRLKVCKACREYNFRETDWVCTVCYKRMEIQAASGDWMNEFVRRPSRRRDARVYVPAADIIKRTIRRSWTISNPTPRWDALRASTELRPYNSLPRGQDISNYPTLALHQTNLRNTDAAAVNAVRPSPTRRAKSEDVYCERNHETNHEMNNREQHESTNQLDEATPKRPTRVNPLLSVSLRETKENRERRKSPKRKTETLTSDNKENKSDKTEKEEQSLKPTREPLPTQEEKEKISERHVSFESHKPPSDLIARTRSLSQSSSSKEVKKMHFATLSLPEEVYSKDETGDANSFVTENTTSVELCDIEPLSGTVFRKMTVRRRRQENMRKMPAVDAGWRRAPETDLFDILLPDGEDYRLVFVNSDSSSKEEDVDDNDSSSASSFPIDECDWDYFEPGVARTQHQVLGWGSPFGSPRVYRKRLIDSPLGSPLLQRRRIRESSDEDVSAPSPSDAFFHPRAPHHPSMETTEALQCVHQSITGHPVDQTRHQVNSCCKTCGSSPAAQFIPIPVPVPIPFPVPWGSISDSQGNPQVFANFSTSNIPSLPLSKSFPQKNDFWQYIAQVPPFVWPFLGSGAPMIDEEAKRDGGDEVEGAESIKEDANDDEEPRGHLECENRGSSASETSSVDSSDEDTDQPRVRRVYNVTGPPTNRESDDALPSSNVTTDCDEDDMHRSSADEREDEESSSGSAETDSNDTGTVADQKPKRFSRVFVVNHKGSSSSSESITSSGENTDSSDNDTDTELDCMVVLTNIKQLDDVEIEGKDRTDDEGNEETVERSEEMGLVRVRYLSEDFEEAEMSCDKEREAVLKHEASSSSGRGGSCDIKDGNVRKAKGRNKRRKGKSRMQKLSEVERTDNLEEAYGGCEPVLYREETTETEKSEWLSGDEELSASQYGNKDRSKRIIKKERQNCKWTDDVEIVGLDKCSYLNGDLGAIAKFIDAESRYSASLFTVKENGIDYNSSNADQIVCDIANVVEGDRKESDDGSGGVYKDQITKSKQNSLTDKIEIKDNRDEKGTTSNNSNDVIGEKPKDLNTSNYNINNTVKDPKINKTVNILDSSNVYSHIDDERNNVISKNTSLNSLEASETKVGGKTDPMSDSCASLTNLKVSDISNGEHTKIREVRKKRVNFVLDEDNGDLKNEVTRGETFDTVNKLSNSGSENANERTVENRNLRQDINKVIDVTKLTQDKKQFSDHNKRSATTGYTSLSRSGLCKDKCESPSAPYLSDRVSTSASKLLGFDDNQTEYILDDLPVKFKDFIATDYTYSSSPGLSDVSAESLSSSDAEKESSRSRVPSTRKECEKEQTVTPRETDGCASACDNHTGVPSSEFAAVNGETSVGQVRGRHAAKYTSLVMITNDQNDAGYQQVSVVTSDTTKVVPGEGRVDRVVVRHTNRQDEAPKQTLDDNPNQKEAESVTVITGAETLSAFEEGLADDDSWVENLSYDDDENDDDDDDFPTNSISENSSSGDEVTLTCSAALDQEDELRGYHRSAIDFTLHTIVEESCEESEVEQTLPKVKKERPASATDLEKYFFFGLGDGTIPSINSNREDAFSETSSIYSEGMESLGGTEENQNENSEELASSRLEKYFLSGFMGFTAERRDSDGSVGSDSEGKPSPEQRRKRLVRARGTGRSHSSSLDNLLANPDLAGSEQHLEAQNNSEDSSSSDSDTYDEILGFEKPDGQFDTVKRKKGKKQKASLEDIRNLETTQEENEGKGSEEDEDGHKTPQPEVVSVPSNLTTNKNQQSRDSGFVGSCDDLLKDQRDINKSPDITLHSDKLCESTLQQKKEDKPMTELVPPSTALTRKDSFNNWSSDEETNLMMCKMRQFFKTMVANSSASKPTTPNLSARTSPKPLPRAKSRCKPPQLVYFENELTRLMKTVPGIRDDQVREIVEYLSSEDTWSDSYDSSDYTSSDLEGASTKSALQQQISDSCKQIINKFDANAEDEEGDAGDGGIVDDSHGLNKETTFVYQKLMASFEKMATEDRPSVTSAGPNSPPLIAKVMHHIGSRLVALMHEVSSGESHASNSPKARNYHRRLQQKLSNASTTTTDEDSTSDTNLPDTFVEETLGNYNMLPRSRSHDLLMSDGNKNLHQLIGGVSDITEEREASDCERFSWRGSFESALLATDSRNKLSLIGGEGSASASALAIVAKRRSAGDLLFSHKSLSREQLDRVRSCGSIGEGNSEDKLWVATATKPNRRRSSVPDTASCGSGASADGEDEEEEIENRATLPRSIQSGPQTTNSLPRLPTNALATMQKAQSHQFLPQNVKSARYRPPGFSRLITTTKRAVSAPGLQPSHQRRGRRSQQTSVPSDDVSLSQAHSSPMLASRGGSKSATPSPVPPGTRRKTASVSSQEWPSNDDDIDRLVALHHNRSSLSSLGLRSDSMASVYSGAGEGRYGFVTVRGQVEFGLQYNYKAGSLEIQIKQCKDLAPVDIKRNRSDPYVKVYLLPDKSKSGKRKTKVKKHTLNPVFDECLKFHMSLNELEIRTLWLTVWHSDMFGRNDFLGEVMMALENKVFDDPTPKWYNLQERTEPFDDMLSFKGDIIVCLKFVPPDITVHKKGKRSRGSLHVLIKEAKALTAVKANGTSDPFCKSYLLPEKGRSTKQKTSIVRRTVNPVWNHTFVYDDVTLQELAERCLELTVWDHDRLASNEFLGGVRFSLGTGKHFGKPVEWMDATGREVNLWKNMLERPNFWVEGCLPLRPTLDTRVS